MTDIPKLKAIPIEFSDGTSITVHEPSGREGLRVYLSCMPALTLLKRVFTQTQDIDKGEVSYAAIDIPDEVITAIHRLFGVMTEITVEQFEKLSVYNQLALLQGFSLFAPKKTLTTAEAETPSLVEGEIVSTTPLTN